SPPAHGPGSPSPAVPRGPVESNAFSRLRTDFLKSPTEKTGAILCSVAAALTYPLLLLLLYLFVDLLVWKGAIPSYSQLSAARKQEFANEWSARDEAERFAAVKRLVVDEGQARPIAAKHDQGPVTAVEWETRWRAGVYLALRDRVNQVAADTAVPEP